MTRREPDPLRMIRRGAVLILCLAALIDCGVSGAPPAAPAPLTPKGPRAAAHARLKGALGDPAAKPVPPPAGPPVDGAAALQARIDALGATGLPGTVRVPGPLSGSDPVVLDWSNVTLSGSGPGSILTNTSGADAFVPGYLRLERQNPPIDPARYRLNSTAGGFGIRTLGEAALVVVSHPLQLGAPGPDGAPDYYRGDAYTWQFVIGPGSVRPWANADFLFGHAVGDGVPAPVNFRAGPGGRGMQSFFRVDGLPERQYLVAWWDTPGPPPWAIDCQIDVAARAVNVWVNGAAVAVGLKRTDADTGWPAGARLETHDQVTPWCLGGNGDTVPTDLELHALGFTAGKVFDASKPTLARLDNRTVAAWRYDDPQLAASLDRNPALPAKSWVRFGTRAGSQVGYWVTPGTGASANISVRDLTLVSKQTGLTIGRVFGLNLERVKSASYGLRGCGSLPVGCSYPVNADGCEWGGKDCAYLGYEQIIRASRTLISYAGRSGVVQHGCVGVWEDTTATFHAPGTESYFRTVGQGYGGVLKAYRTLIDNEDGGPTRAVFDIDQSPYASSLLTIDDCSVSSLACPRFVLVNGRRTQASQNTYPVSFVDVKGLSVYSGMPQAASAVELAGTRGSWVGTLDPQTLGSGAVTGNTENLTVLPLVKAVPAP